MGGGILSVKIFAALIAVVAMVGVLVPMVHAEPEGRIIDVEPRAGELKKAVDNAQEGDILRLKSGSYSGSYSGEEVVITKPITIQGAGSAQTTKYITTIVVPLTVRLDSEYQDKKVTISGFSSSPAEATPDFKYIKIDSKASVDIDDVYIWGIGRGGSKPGQLAEHEATSIYVTDQANGSNINITNTTLDRLDTHYAINIEASEISLNMTGNKVHGRQAVALNNGHDNNITFKNVKIDGRYSGYDEPDVFTIKQQSGTNIVFDGVEIGATKQQGSEPSHVFLFDGAENENTTIRLENGTQITENSPNAGSTIFKFDDNDSASKGNKIIVDGSEKILIGSEKATTAQRYNTSENYAVIGIFNRLGAGEIKLYNIGEAISGLEELSEDDYKFKGWLKDRINETPLAEEDKVTKENTNLDIYPKFVQLLDLTIKVPTSESYQIGEVTDKVYKVEKGETISSGTEPGVKEDIETDLSNIESQQTSSFQGFWFHDEEDKTELYTSDQKEQIFERPITANSTIEGKHSYKVTVNGVTFWAEPNQTLADLATQNVGNFEEAKLNNKSDNKGDFWRYTDKEQGISIEEIDADDYHINQNLNLESQYYVNIEINIGKDAVQERIGEGETLSNNSNSELKEKIAEAKDPEQNGHKVWGRFVTDGGIQIEEDAPINENTSVTAIYLIGVQIGEESDPIMIDEGTKPSQNAEQSEKIRKALKALETAIPEGHYLDGFLVNDQGGSVFDQELLPTSVSYDIDDYSGNVDNAINAIMDEPLYGNTTILAEYKVKVTIKTDGGDIELKDLETGTTLGSILEGEDSQNKTLLKNAIYGDETKKERFYKFKITNQEDRETEDYFDLRDPITKELILKPKYLIYVTMDDVTGKVVEGTRYDEFVDDALGKATEKLATMRDGISHDTPESSEEYLHFDKIVISNDDGSENELPEDGIIYEDIKLASVYHYDLDIVTDYDNHNEGLARYTVRQGKSISETDNGENAEHSLESLVTSVNSNDNRKFYQYYDEKHNEIHADSDSIVKEVHDKHLYITAKVAYKVQIGETVGYVPEGQTIADALAEDMQNEAGLVKALQELQNTDNKQFAEFTLENGNIDITNIDTITNALINGYTKIGAKYNVKVTIGESSYDIPENGKLGENLNGSKQAEVRAALQALSEAVPDKTFVGFDDQHGHEIGKGKDLSQAIEDVMNYQFNQNSTIEANHEAKVYIDKQLIEGTTTGGNLSSLDEEILKPFKEKCTKYNKIFSRFTNNATNETFEEDQLFGENDVNLTTQCGYGLTIGEDSATKFAIENGTIAQNYNYTNEIAPALEKLKTQEGKSFDRFIDQENNEILVDSTPITKPTTIKPVFYLTVTISGVENESFTCFIDEGNTLEKCRPADLSQDLDTFLYSLENKPDVRDFKNYTLTKAETLSKAINFDGGEESSIENKDALMKETFTSSANVKANYTVKVKVGESDPDPIVVDYGTTYADKKGNLEDKVDLDDSKYSSLHHFEVEGVEVKDTDQFTRHTTLTPKFNVNLTIKDAGNALGEDGTTELLEGRPISEATDLLDKVRQNAEANQKRFEGKFTDAELTDTDAIVTENKTLTPKYVIDVTVKGDPDRKFTLNENDTLAELLNNGYAKPEDFKEYRDANTNEKIEENEPLTKHTTVKAIYTITITLPDGSHTQQKLEAGQTISNLSGLGINLNEYKEDPTGENRNFDRFVDQNGKEIKEDTELYSDIELIPKFKNTLIFKPYADNELVLGVDPAEFNVELGEDLTLNDLSTENNGKLWKWLDSVSTALAAQGKPDYNPTSYLLEIPNGDEPEDPSLVTTTEVDLDKTDNFENGDIIRAVFTYNPSPVVPDTPTSTPTTDTAQNVIPKAPNTGVGTNDTTAFTVVGAITVIIAASALVFEFVQRGYLRK